MRIGVTVKANAKFDRVEKSADGTFKVHVKQPAKEGKANKAIIEVLSEYFGRPKSAIRITIGENSKNKIIDIL